MKKDENKRALIGATNLTAAAIAITWAIRCWSAQSRQAETLHTVSWWPYGIGGLLCFMVGLVLIGSAVFRIWPERYRQMWKKIFPPDAE